jgi:hypothetical protein
MVKVAGKNKMLAAVAAFLLVTIGCGGTPTGPTSTSETTTVNYAYTPTGTTDGVWKVGFSSTDLKLRFPKAVQLQIGALPTEVQIGEGKDAVMVKVRPFLDEAVKITNDEIGEVRVYIGGNTGAPFSMSLDSNFTCGEYGKTAGCTWANPDGTGQIVSGEIKFAQGWMLTDVTSIVREIFRAFGLSGMHNEPGIFQAGGAWGERRLSDHERVMVRERLKKDLLSVYAPAPPK